MTQNEELKKIAHTIDQVLLDRPLAPRRPPIAIGWHAYSQWQDAFLAEVRAVARELGGILGVRIGDYLTDQYLRVCMRSILEEKFSFYWGDLKTWPTCPWVAYLHFNNAAVSPIPGSLNQTS